MVVVVRITDKAKNKHFRAFYGKKSLKTANQFARGYNCTKGLRHQYAFAELLLPYQAKPAALGCSCPTCSSPARDESYKLDGIVWPIITNRRTGYTGWGDYDAWDELHKCSRCKTLYYFNNGSY